ncbi:mucin-13 isoform X3 [Chrysemys picta bellii]|uniref:mucin-13 isoform X3 n=1 Tax=Chrysemys picta bellii TaxID=8478 RepID=UPI0032B26494
MLGAAPVSTTSTESNTTTALTTTLENTTTPATTNTPAPTTTLENTTTPATTDTPATTNTTAPTNTTATTSTPAPTTTVVNATTPVPNNTTVNATTQILTTSTGDASATPSASATTVNATTQILTTSTGDASATPSASATIGTHSSTAPPVTTKLPVTTAPPATTEAPLPCANKPCRSSAKCINLHPGYTCECLDEYYYTTLGCQEGKVFPGQFTLKITYTDSMANENTPEYGDLYRNITDFFNTTFRNETDYEQTIIENVKQSSAKSKIQSKAEISGTSVTVRNMFTVTTKLTPENVTNLIKDAMKDNTNFKIESYQALSQCDIYQCDEATTTCKENDGITCECKPGFSKKNPRDKSCLGCDNTCSKENHMHCVTDSNSAPVCQCLPNFQNKDGNCVECDVGYSGVNCSNNSLLILIIVAVLCGALILGLIAGLVVTSVRANKSQRSPEKRHLLTEDYSNKRDTPGHISAINSAANDKIFPRIQTSNAAQVNRGFEISNPYEMGPPTRKLPERDYDDDEYEMSSRSDGFRLQRKY